MIGFATTLAGDWATGRFTCVFLVFPLPESLGLFDIRGAVRS